MWKAICLLLIGALVFAPRQLNASERFDGNWKTTLTCPAKGNTEGYTWTFVSVILNGNLHGERGSAGQPGYLSIDGSVADDGKAKLAASGVVASRTYARGVFVSEGDDYSYKIKAQFNEKSGSGTRDEGLGIVGRPCTFDFTRQ